MIKHNLPLVRGGSLWQYRSVLQLQLWQPHCPPHPPNVNTRTATVAHGLSLYDEMLLLSHHSWRPALQRCKWCLDTKRKLYASVANQPKWY